MPARLDASTPVPVSVSAAALVPRPRMAGQVAALRALETTVAQIGPNLPK